MYLFKKIIPNFLLFIKISIKIIKWLKKKETFISRKNYNLFMNLILLLTKIL